MSSITSLQRMYEKQLCQERQNRYKVLKSPSLENIIALSKTLTALRTFPGHLKVIGAPNWDETHRKVTLIYNEGYEIVRNAYKKLGMNMD